MKKDLRRRKYVASRSLINLIYQRARNAVLYTIHILYIGPLRECIALHHTSPVVFFQW